MSNIEYRTLRCRVSQGIDWQTEGDTLLTLCEGLIAEGSEYNIGDAAALLRELEIQNNLGIDHLEVLKELLRGIEKWALIDKIVSFENKRKNYQRMLEKIICKLDELNDLERLINVSVPYLAEDRLGGIESVRVLFKELESKNRLGPAYLGILKKILEETGEDELLWEVNEFEKKRKDEDITDRQRKEAEERNQARAAAVYAVPRAVGRLMGAVNVHCNFKTVGGVVVAVGAGVVLYKYSRGDNDIQQFAHFFNGAILPAATSLRAIGNGSLCFTVQAENRAALQLLWQQYQTKILQTRLQAFLVSDEIRQLADGDEVIVTVYIDEQEYQDACLDFVMEERVFINEVNGSASQRNRRNSDSFVYMKPKESEVAAVLSSLKTAEIEFQQEQIDTLKNEIDRISKTCREQEEPDLEIKHLGFVTDQPDNEIRGETFTPPVFLDWSRRENVDSYLRCVKPGHGSNDSSYGSENEFGGYTWESSEDCTTKTPVLKPVPLEVNETELGNKEEFLRGLIGFNIEKHDFELPTYYFQAEESQGLFKAEAGREIKILFSTKDAKGDLLYDADNQVNVRIQTLSGSFVKKNIEDDLTGSYIVSFIPDSVGPHSVIITVNGQPLTDSPWSVEVYPHQYKCVFDITSNEARWPSIAVNKKTNEIAVACKDLVQILSADHSYVRDFRLGKESRIEDMDFTTNGSFIMIVRKLNTTFITFNPLSLLLFDQGGQFIKHIGEDYLKSPHSVSTSRDGNIVVCDCTDKSVKVLSPDGTKLLQSIKAPDCQSLPWYAVYHQHMFFVSYPASSCVKKFNEDGVFLYDIGSEGFGEGQLFAPYGLAIDKFDSLIIPNYGNRTLQAFTMDGKFLNTFTMDEKFRNTMDWRWSPELGIISGLSVASSNTGNLYVSDFGGVQVFQ
ncbi:uncharacterized protein LOC111336627 [Stylophora pistillata]|uniref:Tripartite motif-containing protein 2 n=1 Tax=Stylophora pistillata TaxID=50429 RepID=A0A2B4RWD1_STYPI|nr:uncharacterized protein LOC111336627 [Stylophora pistillata]PFX20638.1 Tripartite motif-containing protein 2 [Stylophora pistillata]